MNADNIDSVAVDYEKIYKENQELAQKLKEEIDSRMERHSNGGEHADDNIDNQE